MRKINRYLSIVSASALLALPGWGQSAKLQLNLDHLKDNKNVVETVNLALDRNLLQLGANFLPKEDADAAKVKQLVQGLEGIYIRSFKFDKEYAYSTEDVEAIRRQLVAPAWSCIVQVHTKRGRQAASSEDESNADICLRQQDGKILGLAILAAEPKELTVVNIAGSITPEQLSDLAGHFGIPEMHDKAKPPKPAPKAKEAGKNEE
jgi:hypothetical protein